MWGPTIVFQVCCADPRMLRVRVRNLARAQPTTILGRGAMLEDHVFTKLLVCELFVHQLFVHRSVCLPNHGVAFVTELFVHVLFVHQPVC